MRAVTIRDSELLVEEHPDPGPARARSWSASAAAGLNGADMHQRHGRYPAPPGSPPDIPGLELAGEVAGARPRSERFSEGDRVMAIVGGGGQAELAVVHERQLMPVPESLDWPQAGGLPEVFTTAHDAVFTQAGLRPASTCSSTAAPAASAPPRSSSARRPAPASPRPCATRICAAGGRARRAR